MLYYIISIMTTIRVLWSIYGLNPMKYPKLYYVTSWPDYPGPARYSSNERGTVSHYNQRFDNTYS